MLIIILQEKLTVIVNINESYMILILYLNHWFFFFLIPIYSLTHKCKSITQLWQGFKWLAGTLLSYLFRDSPTACLVSLIVVGNSSSRLMSTEFLRSPQWLLLSGTPLPRVNFVFLKVLWLSQCRGIWVFWSRRRKMQERGWKYVCREV